MEWCHFDIRRVYYKNVQFDGTMVGFELYVEAVVALIQFWCVLTHLQWCLTSHAVITVESTVPAMGSEWWQTTTSPLVDQGLVYRVHLIRIELF